MERYLTKKCRPAKGVKLLENAAMIIGFGLMAGCIGITAYLLMTIVQRSGVSGLSWRNFLLLIPAILLALGLNHVGERIRARKHAQVIVGKLMQAGGCIPADEAEAVIGVRRAADTAQALVEKGYLTDVKMIRGVMCFADAAEAVDAPAEEIRPLFRDVEV